MRCDRCGAEPPLKRWQHKDGRSLDLCPIHTSEHYDALRRQDWTERTDQ